MKPPEVSAAHRLEVEEDLMNQPSTDSTQTGSILAAPARAAIFTALRPALEVLFVDAGNDAQLSAEARRICQRSARLPGRRSGDLPVCGQLISLSAVS